MWGILRKLFSMTLAVLLCSGCAAISGASAAADGVKLSDDASDFVLLSEAVPDAILEIRYYSTYNFVGDRIDGYEEPLAFLTKEAAAALREVSDELVGMGYRLKIFDAYRPQMAVTHFMNWALDTEDTRMKQYFYPELEKDALFPQGYIAEHSGHSRGSTVDLTLFDMATEREVDMGGTFDYFGELSHPDYTGVTGEQYANRMFLREVMLKHGFKPLAEEWWHFTLADEPYPDTYFTFPINSDSLAAEGAPMENEGIDYLALVNKLNPLPEGWEEALETVHVTNSLGDDVEVEARAYAAYELLRADLLENDGIEIELDSARRSIAAQQDIMDRFIEKYGADYAAKTVAQPGYSEHHTGLALDLYFRLDGADVYYNEDMVQYPEIWEKIHAKLADYGFILRYLPDKEHITGYGYEPWHIRYVDDTGIAREIMSQSGMTLEVYLGAVNDTDPVIDYGASELYTEEELAEAAVQIKCRFASFAGCELHALRYAGDGVNTPENLEWLNGLDEGNTYTECIGFLGDFHSPAEGMGAWAPDMEYTDYQWWLARTEEGGWQLLSWGD